MVRENKASLFIFLEKKNPTKMNYIFIIRKDCDQNLRALAILDEKLEIFIFIFFNFNFPFI